MFKAIDAYYIVAEHLDAGGLLQTDATCKLFKQMNASLWQAMGRSEFYGLELPDHGVFKEQQQNDEAEQQRRKHLCVDWRRRFQSFWLLVREFRKPFGTRICTVENPDEVAYFLCYLRRDILTAVHPTRHSDLGIYFEIDVSDNADNISFGIISDDDGGKTSLTFGPMTGAVLRESLKEQGIVQGAYIQPLSKMPPPAKFMGRMGAYIKGGELAFFRKVKDQRWETTGFVADLSWAEGKRLTPCLAFRNPGLYNVSVTHVGPTPPVMPQRADWAFKVDDWKGYVI